MAPADVGERAERAEQLYKDHLQATLEATHRDDFVAIEPDSGDYYVAGTVENAVAAARQAHPTLYPHVIRIGHEASAAILGVSR
jgi:hypothetical protein